MKKQLFYLIGMVLIIYIIPLYITFNPTWFIDTSGGRFVAVLGVIYLFIAYLKSISKSVKNGINNKNNSQFC